jgi:hypothetical protein
MYMASPPFSIDQLLASVGGPAHGSHQSKLNRATLAVLADFATYLVRDEGQAPNTARAYKSWFAKALVEHGAHDSHVKSAVQAFSRYWDSK